MNGIEPKEWVRVVRYRNSIIKLKAMMSFKLNMVRVQGERRVKRPNI